MNGLCSQKWFIQTCFTIVNDYVVLPCAQQSGLDQFWSGRCTLILNLCPIRCIHCIPSLSWHDTSYDGSGPILTCQTSIQLSVLLCRRQIDSRTILQWSIMTNGIRICWNSVFPSPAATSLEQIFLCLFETVVSQWDFGHFGHLRMIWKAHNLL